MKLKEHLWRRVAKTLRITGVICFFVVFVAHFGQLAYFIANRPDVPRPESGFTVALYWTHPTRYGTAWDERLSQYLFELGFPSVGLIAVGELIRIYKLNDYSGVPTRPK